jgi:lysophospholipase L1-like esterase
MRNNFSLALLAMVLPGAAAAQTAPSIPAWIASTSFKPAKLRDGEVMGYSDQSVRQDIRVQTRTTRIRLRLTNELGSAAVRLDRVELRPIAKDGSLGAPVGARFNRQSGTTIEPGAAAYTDEFDFASPAFGDIAITVHYPSPAEPVAHRLGVRVANGIATPAGSVAPSKGPAIVSAVETLAPKAACRHVVVALGDSITEGAGSTENNDWPSQFGRRMANARCQVVVLNAGIGGNRVLSNSGSPGLLARLDRDVLALPGVTDIVFVEGINDIRGLEMADPTLDIAAAAETLLGAYRQLVARAHAHGIRVIGGTILPYKGTGKQSQAGLAIVDRVNAAIRTEGIFDAVVDFNRATADPADPRRMRPDWHKGDWLHPNDAGYAAMAKAVPSALFGKRK